MTSAHISEINWKSHQKYKHKKWNGQIAKKMKISLTCQLHMAGACISEISRKSSSASTGGKIPPQEERQLKIYELCRTPRKLWYIQSLFFAFTKEDQNFHRPVLESKSYVSKVSSNSQSLSDLFLWSEFSVPFKTFQKGISLIKKFPRSYNSTKKILNKRWKFIRSHSNQRIYILKQTGVPPAAN